MEDDEERRGRIILNVVGAARRSTPPRALVGQRGEDRVCLIVSPLYLDFVEILYCRYDPDVGIREAWHKWLAHATDVAKHGAEVGAQKEAALPVIVEELAHAVVADRRAGRSAPPTTDAIVCRWRRWRSNRSSPAATIWISPTKSSGAVRS